MLPGFLEYECTDDSTSLLFMISFDTETTGKDLRHGAKPFFVTICREGEDPEFWQWEVDPLTREPIIPDGELEEIRETIYAEDLVLQNAKFDVAAWAAVGGLDGQPWDWDRTYDTLRAGHVLASNRDHDLTSLGIQYLGHTIEPFERALKDAVVKARRLARSKFPDWRIARPGLPEMPSCKKSSGKDDKTWGYDFWLPRALWLAGAGEPSWENVLEEYSCADSWLTVNLWRAMRSELERRQLWDIYFAALQVDRIAWKMETKGVTLHRGRLNELQVAYSSKAKEFESKCLEVAAKHSFPLALPKAGRNKSLDTFVFDVLKLEKVYDQKGKSEGPMLDAKVAIPHWLGTLPEGSDGHTFIKALSSKRTLDTQVTYMEGYRRFWKCLGGRGLFKDLKLSDWYVLHPHLNPTGTDTLRWSCKSPNEQNISTKAVDPTIGAPCLECRGEGCPACNHSGIIPYNLRYCFGPGPGREWWSCDAKNIELRIPAYESGERELIDLFERPDEPPYFGSNHLLIAHLLHRDKFESCINPEGKFLDGRLFKERFLQIYKRVKNGNFAVQYGAVDRPDGLGTADRTYGVPGAQALIKSKFVKQEQLNQHWIRFANKHGYVETIPDTSVDPRRGYPLLCARTERGFVKPTVPLNYHVQGTAMWWMYRAMTRCQEQLNEWNATAGSDLYFIVLQVHDELVFDFPRRVKADPKTGRVEYLNLPRVRKLQRLMELGGEGIGIPTPVSCEYHPESWSVGIAL